MATATEVSTIAVLYAMIIGMVLYGGIRPSKIYDMLVETAALSGAILIILGTASAMAWALFIIILIITVIQIRVSRRFVYYAGEGR